MKRRLLCSWEGDGADLVKTVKRLIKSQAIKNTVIHSRTQSQIRLNLQFNEFDVKALNSNVLSETPYLHAYFTSCSDVDNYKTDVKPKIAKWFSLLHDHNCENFLVIVVVATERKLQLRSSVVDRIKTDYLSRYPNKLVVLHEPTRDTPKSRESWAALCDRVIELTLSTIEIAFERLSEAVRVEREARNKPSWDFSRFFLLQEEVAILYEALGLHSDALIQYDELDAMLTQYLENAKAGDKPVWLTPLLSADISRWEAFNLHQNFESELVARIRSHEATLLDFRNYLFTRKARLMSHLHRSDELAKCAYSYVSSSFNELRGLTNISIIGLRTWAILASLESYLILERASEVLTKTNDNLTIFGASILELARGHLFKLGCEVDLIHGDGNKEMIDDAINGFSNIRAESDEVFDENENSAALRHQGTFAAPMEVLRSALSSPDQFEHHYLEISLKTIATFKRINRDRTASVVGGELAKYHFLRGNYLQAEDLLLELVEVYKNDGWDVLVDAVHKRLVQLYTKSNKIEKLAKVYYGMVKGDSAVFTKFYNTIQSGVTAGLVKDILRFSLEQVSRPTSAKCSPSSRVDINQKLTVNIELDCQIPLEGINAEIWLDEVTTAIEPSQNYSVVSQSIASNSMVDVFSLGRDTIHTQQSMALSGVPSAPFSGFCASKTSSDSGEGLLVHNNQIRFFQNTNASGPELRYSLHTDPRTRKPRSAGISSPSVRILRHKLLKKETRSAPTFEILEHTNIRPSIVSRFTKQLCLPTGINEIEFDLNTSKPGRFTISRFCLFYKLGPCRIELVSQLLDPCVHIEVLDTPPVITMSLEDEKLFTGISGTLNFTILVGSRSITNEDITFEMTKGLELISASTMATVKNYSFKDGKRCPQKYDSFTKYELNIHRVGDNIVEMSLPSAQARCEVSFALHVRSPLQYELEIANASESDSSIGDLDDFLDEPDSNVGSTKSHHISATLKSIPQKHGFAVQFFNPFKFKSDVQGDLLSLTMKNICPVVWFIRRCSCKCVALSKEPLEAIAKSELNDIQLVGNQSVNLVWYVKTKVKTNLEFIWEFTFECQSHSINYEYYDDFSGQKPLYAVTNHARDINADTGLVPLSIEVRRLESSEDNEHIAWHIADNRSAWAICGRTSGVISFDNTQLQTISVDLMPLFMGKLRLPQVDIKRFITTNGASEHDSSMSSIDGPMYKGRKRLAFEFGEIELVNPLNQLAHT